MIADKWKTANLGLAIFLVYLYPDNFAGIDIVGDLRRTAKFCFRPVAGVDFGDLADQFFSEESVIVGNARALLDAATLVKRALAEARSKAS